MKATCLKTFEGSNVDIYCLVINSNANEMASSTKYGQICIWDVCSGKCVKTIQGHNSAIYGLVYFRENAF